METTRFHQMSFVSNEGFLGGLQLRQLKTSRSTGHKDDLTDKDITLPGGRPCAARRYRPRRHARNCAPARLRNDTCELWHFAGGGQRTHQAICGHGAAARAGFAGFAAQTRRSPFPASGWTASLSSASLPVFPFPKRPREQADTNQRKLMCTHDGCHRRARLCSHRPPFACTCQE